MTVLDELTKVLIGLTEGNWCIWYCDPKEKEAANQLVKMGLVILETNEPKESGEAPVGAWKLNQGIKDKILQLGATQLLAETKSQDTKLPQDEKLLEFVQRLTARLNTPEGEQKLVQAMKETNLRSKLLSKHKRPKGS